MENVLCYILLLLFNWTGAMYSIKTWNMENMTHFPRSLSPNKIAYVTCVRMSVYGVNRRKSCFPICKWTSIDWLINKFKGK